MKVLKRTCKAGIVTGVIFGMLLLKPDAWALGGYGGWGMGPGMMMGGWGGGWLMIAFWVMVLVALILLIRWLLQVTRGEKDGFRRPSAIEIIKERYARGEITQTEYLSMKKDLAD